MLQNKSNVADSGLAHDLDSLGLQALSNVPIKNPKLVLLWDLT